MPKVKTFEEKYGANNQNAKKQLDPQQLEERRRILVQRMAYAREVGKQQREEKRKKQLEILAQVTQGVTEDIEKTIAEYIDKHSTAAIRTAFLQAFTESGGKRGLIQWIKESPRHRQEYYKMLVSLIKQDETSEKQSTKIIVNIIGANDEKNEIVINGQNIDDANISLDYLEAEVTAGSV